MGWVPSWLRRHGVSLSIACLATVLGAYLYFVDSGKISTHEAELRKRNLLRAFRRGEITAIAVSQGGEEFRIVKRGDDAGDALYYLDNGEIADQTAVDKTFGALEFATPERRIGEPSDKHAMGLDAPKVRLVVSMGPVVYKLAIGGPAPSPAGAAYAELEGEGTFVIGREVKADLERPRDFYRGRTLVPYLSSTLAELSLEGSGGTRRFVSGKSGWSILRGDQKIRVEREAFDRMLVSLAELRAEAFTSDAEAEAALAGAEIKVHLTMSPRASDLPQAIIDVGGACPAHPEDIVAVRRQPLPRKSACVPKGSIDALAADEGAFADLRLFSLRADEMEQISLVAGAERLELVRVGTSWRLRLPSEGPVEPDVGNGFARTLHDLRAESIVGHRDESPSAAVRRSATIAKPLEGGDEKQEEETIELGAPDVAGFVEARRVAEGALLRLSAEIAAVLRPSGLTLRSRKVIDEAPTRVLRVVVESSTVHQTISRSSSGGLTFDVPKSLAIDPGLGSDVIDALARLRAERWVAEKDDGTFGLAHPSATYELGLSSGSVRVETGRAAAGGVFARRTDQPEIFVMSDAARRAVETWAVDRSYFMFEPAEIRKVRWQRGAKRWLLEPSASGKTADAQAERFEKVRKALAEMRTEGTVHLGAAKKEEGFDHPLATLAVELLPPPPAIGREVRIVIGRGDAFRETSVFYVRREGVDATFAIAQSKLRPLLDLQ